MNYAEAWNLTEPSRKLDAFLAEKLLNWKVEWVGEMSISGDWTGGDIPYVVQEGEYRQVRLYSKNAGEALDLAISADVDHISLKMSGKEWSCRLSGTGQDAKASTLAMAICRALLMIAQIKENREQQEMERQSQ